MALAVKHKFVSGKGDPADTTLVRPSNWNDSHDITLAADSLIGRDSSGAGAAQEIPCTPQGRALIAASDPAALGMFTTGDVKLTLKNAADAGWLMMNDGTIGPTGSSAGYADDANQALYTLLWTNIGQTYAPVTGGRGVSAAADWAAKKPLRLVQMLGRALAVAGVGGGLTPRTFGSTFGEEYHLLIKQEIPSAVIQGISVAISDTRVFGQNGVNGSTGGNAVTCFLNASTDVPSNVHAASVVSGAISGAMSWVDNGQDVAHNNVQPSTYLNVMIKL